MSTQVPPIGKPNFIAIAGMSPGDLIKAREYYIVRMVSARRSHDSDTLEAVIDWIVALTGEMRLRGGTMKQEDSPIITF